MDVEDILNDALSSVLDGPSRADPDEDGVVRYGPLVLRVAPKEGKANTLLADHLFSPALVIAERIERRLLSVSSKAVLELGAGAALPSLLSTILPLPDAPKLVVVTDYPDAAIMGNVERNVRENTAVFSSGVDIRPVGYEWGAETKHLLSILPPGSEGYNVLILSDLLHFRTSHPVLLSSLCSLMARTPTSRAYVGAGKYTPAVVCDEWVQASRKAGLEMEEVTGETAWMGGMEVVWSGNRMDAEALTERKTNCRLWIGRWANP